MTGVLGPQRADVYPELDCFYCSSCGWNGRISGAWFVGLLHKHGWSGDVG